MVRLVKGAYWDTEIKLAQERGLAGYPVFTRKAATDVSYLACAQRLLAAGRRFFPQFATHNAHTFAAVLECAGGRRDFEFQSLHGMGEALYERGGPERGLAVPRLRAGGRPRDLLAYLVRRLLENGANTSFVNRSSSGRRRSSGSSPIPSRAAALPDKPHPRIPLPRVSAARPAEFARHRPRRPRGARATGATDRARDRAGAPTAARAGRPGVITEPADRRRIVGAVPRHGGGGGRAALGARRRCRVGRDAGERARGCARARGGLLERRYRRADRALRARGRQDDARCAREVREAVDFCRYYAARARAEFAEPLRAARPDGRAQRARARGRGVFACISPWNFPLAIFTGQVTAALAAGNAVVAKPAEQTPLIAARAVALLHEAGVPARRAALAAGDRRGVGAPLVRRSAHRRRRLHRLDRDRARHQPGAGRARGPIVPLIAETGGLNAMIVDSSALPEQVVRDVLASAFQSAGQRCSALRVLFVQEDIAAILEMLAGAMAELAVGDPALLETDVGPVIDEEAKGTLEAQRSG